MPDFLYLDIETIPASDPAIIAEIERKVTPPASMKKAETIEKWEAEEKPKAVADAVAKTSFNGALGQICCIGWAWNDGDVQAIDASPPYWEADLLFEMSKGIITTRPSNEQPVIVGHYVAGFDIRFIWQRAFVLGVRLPAWFPRDPKPWSAEVHDTMTMWAGARDTISLDDLAKALGLPGKGNMTGADVAGMWAEKRFDEIAEYCRQDVELVRKIHRKMLLSMGEIA